MLVKSRASDAAPLWPIVRTWTLPLTVGAAYFIAARVGEALAFPSAPVSVLWAPNAILMAALMLTSRDRWWLYLAGVLPFHLFAQLDFPLTRVVTQYFANVGLAMLGALAVGALTPNPQRFDRVRGALTLVLFGGLLAPVLTSILMAAFFTLSGISGEMWLTVVARTVTNTFAVVTLVPLIVHCAERLRSGQRPISVRRAAEAMTLALITLAVCVLLLFIPVGSPERTPLLLYAPLPLVAWASIRFGVAGSCAACLTAGAVSMLAMVNGYGPLSASDPVGNALSLVTYHVVISIIFLTAAALLHEWRFAGRALSVSIARFRSIFENNIIPTAIWHGDLRISEANAAFLRLTGYSDDDIQSGKLRFDDLATLDTRSAGHAAEADLESTDLLERFDSAELELALRDGRRVPVILGHCRFPADEGGVIYALDLSSFRRAEARRQRVESLHAAVLTSLHDQIAVVDSRGAVIEINDSWRRAVDCALPSRFDRVLAGESYLQACARAAEQGDRTAIEHLAALRAVLNGSDDRRLLECREVTGADLGWFEVCFECLRRSEGGAVITRTDVTARKRAETDARNQRQQLTHLSRAAVLGQLSGAFAHELKQPLTSILGNAEAALSMLHAGDANQDELREILLDIVQDDERATQVIQRLRALLAKGDAQYAPVEINDVVRESLELTHSEFVTRNVVATLHLDPDMPTALADRVQMQQVVLNLLMNACEAMVGTPLPRRQAIVCTRFLAATEAVEITVQDNGPGIAVADTDRIFQPFVTTKTHGLGLGLAICRSVAEAHHGVLWAENTTEGGAIFHVKIPIAGGPP